MKAKETNHYSDIMRCYQKSAEVIVGMKRASKKKGTEEDSQNNRRAEC